LFSMGLGLGFVYNLIKCQQGTKIAISRQCQTIQIGLWCIYESSGKFLKDMNIERVYLKESRGNELDLYRSRKLQRLYESNK